LRLATAMQTELYIPEPVLHERGEQWARKTLVEIESAGNKAITVQKAISSFVSTPVLFQAPSEKELRSGYSSVEQRALQELGLKTCPSGSLSLDEAFKFAVARDFT